MERREPAPTRDHWYVVTASRRLSAGPVGVRLFDLSLVVFRGSDGKPHALLDRCCHRAVRLSLGWVEGGTIVCRYHGWRYDGDGRCVHIPSLIKDQHIPPAARVPSFPCVERNGYVWVWPGEEKSDLAAPPPIPEFGLHRWVQGVVPMRCTATKILENNMDWCHPSFAHPWTHGQFFVTRFSGFRDQCYEVRIFTNGMTVFAPVTASADDPVPDRPTVSLTFTLPNRIRVEFWKPFHLLIYLMPVPTSDTTCRLEWMLTRLLPFGRRVVGSNREPKVFAQDRSLLESIETYDVEQQQNVPADTSTLLLREILRRAEMPAGVEGGAPLPARRIIRVRS